MSERVFREETQRLSAMLGVAGDHRLSSIIGLLGNEERWVPLAPVDSDAIDQIAEVVADIAKKHAVDPDEMSRVLRTGIKLFPVKEFGYADEA